MNSLFSKISLKEACSILGISEATGKNWTKSGELKPFKDDSYYLQEVLNLKNEIKTGKTDRLQSRRNKSFNNDKKIIKNYIDDELSLKLVNQILEDIDIDLDEQVIHIILAEYSLKTYDLIIDENQYVNEIKLIKPYKNDDFYQFVHTYLAEMNVNIEEITNLNEYKFLNHTPIIITDDFFGLLYQNLISSRQKKRGGSYYTPSKIVSYMVDDLSNDLILDNKSIIDPCCGSGNFLIELLKRGHSIENLYGMDIDPTSVFLTRVSLFLMSLPNGNFLSEIVNNISLKNSLSLKNSPRKYDICIGNPPWGAELDEKSIKIAKNNFEVFSKRGMESFSLFIELAIDLVFDSGIVSYIVPETLLSVGAHTAVRRSMMEELELSSLKFWGNAFEGVLAPAVSFKAIKSDRNFASHLAVTLKDNTNYIVKNRIITDKLWSFHTSDLEASIIEKITKKDNNIYLKDNAEFALGLVTGNNKKYLEKTPSEFNQPIVRGSDIKKYSIDSINNYIVYRPQEFQQVPKNELYFSEEKLIYRFISDTLVFAYDDSKILTLNSANVLVPHIKDIDIKYVCAILNSSVAHFIFKKEFNSIKILRKHIEAIPIRIPDARTQEIIINYVDKLILSKDKEESKLLYSRLDRIIFDLYNLNNADIDVIKKSTKNNIFL